MTLLKKLCLLTNWICNKNDQLNYIIIIIVLIMILRPHLAMEKAIPRSHRESDR